jgi:hypothetical protein
LQTNIWHGLIKAKDVIIFEGWHQRLFSELFSKCTIAFFSFLSSLLI